MSPVLPAAFKRQFLIPFPLVIPSGGQGALLVQWSREEWGPQMSILFQVWHLEVAVQCCSPLHTTPLLMLGTKKHYHPSLSPFLKLKGSPQTSSHPQIRLKVARRLQNYYCIGLQHTAESPPSQHPHRRLISLGNQAKNINQAELPREAVPVGSG